MPVASTSGSSWLAWVRSGRRRKTRPSPAAWKTACGRTTPSLHSPPSFAKGDPNAPPLDSESLPGLLDRYRVAYVLVGGLAAVAPGAMRATFDIDNEIDGLYSARSGGGENHVAAINPRIA